MTGEVATVPSASAIAGHPEPHRAGTGEAAALRHYRLARGRLRDVPSLVRLYRDRSPESIATYHPFPFDRLRLTLVFLWLVSAGPFARWLAARLPRWVAVILVVFPEESHRAIAYGTVRFMSPTGEAPWAKMGYLVADAHQGLGLGRALGVEMIRTAVGCGIRYGGGSILQKNAASVAVATRLGFTTRQSAIPDRGAPDAVNLTTFEDLHEVLRGIERSGAPPTPRRSVVVVSPSRRSALGSIVRGPDTKG